MANITATAAQVGVVYPDTAEIFDFVAHETITAGQPVYWVAATGKVGIADANGSGTVQFRGIALNGGGAGQAISVLKKGHAYGYTLTSLDYGAILYLSDTAGSLADSAGSTSVICGRVAPIPVVVGGSLTKVAYIDADWVRTWA